MKNLTKKLVSTAVLALAGSPAFAGVLFNVDFEKAWDFGNGDVNTYYAGGSAADGSSGGPNLGVSFTNVSGVSNDALGPYYANAPSPKGVAYAHDTGVLMNLATGIDGVNGALQFYYSTSAAAPGALKAYSGANGTGTLLGTIDLAANDLNGNSLPDVWSLATFHFNGVAKSFDLSGSVVDSFAFDNITAVPEPGSLALLAGALGVLGVIHRRKKQVAA